MKSPATAFARSSFSGTSGTGAARLIQLAGFAPR
jgi:hypothetical protein